MALLRGATQVLDSSIGISKLIDDFLAGSNWDITNGNNNATITGLAPGANPYDAVNYQQLIDLINGRQWKQSVRAFASGNIVLSGNQTVDGITLATGDRVACLNQSTVAEDGIYIVDTAGSWTRADDWKAGEGAANYSFYVEDGTSYADTQWTITNNSTADTIGTHDLTPNQTGGAGTIVAGAGLLLTGNTIDVQAADLSLTINADDMQVNIGNTNGTSLEVSATGLELVSNVTGNRTFSGGTFDVNATGNATIGASGSVTLKSTTAGNVEIEAGSGASVNIGKGDNITFDDLQVQSATATSTTPIPFAVTKTSGSAGDIINDFRNAFTDEAVINAIMETYNLANGGFYTFDSGLTETSGTVNLGGPLTANADLTNATMNYSFTLGATDLSDKTTSFSVTGGTVGATVNSVANSGTQRLLMDGDHIYVGSTVAHSTSGTPFAGMQYDHDYSADYTARSLVDKEYVDGLSNNLDEAYEAGAGSPAVPALQTITVDSGSVHWKLVNPTTNVDADFRIVDTNDNDIFRTTTQVDASGNLESESFYAWVRSYVASPTYDLTLQTTGDGASAVGNEINIFTEAINGATGGDINIGAESGGSLTLGGDAMAAFGSDSGNAIIFGSKIQLIDDGTGQNLFGTTVEGLRIENYATASLPTVPTGAFGSLVFDTDDDRFKVWVTDADGSGTDGWKKILLDGDSVSTNLYNSDGSLTGNRTVTMTGYDLTFIDNGNANTFTASAGTVALSGDSNVTFESTNGGITFEDPEVTYSIAGSAIPFAVTKTAGSTGDIINEFNNAFTDKAIINAIVQNYNAISSSTSTLDEAYEAGAGPITAPADQTITMDSGSIIWALDTTANQDAVAFKVNDSTGSSVINAVEYSDTNGVFSTSGLYLRGNTTTTSKIPLDVVVETIAGNSGVTGGNVELKTSSYSSATSGSIVLNSGTSITFSDSEVIASSTSGIPFAITNTVGSNTNAGDIIAEFRSSFTDEAIINAIVENHRSIASASSTLDEAYEAGAGTTNNHIDHVITVDSGSVTWDLQSATTNNDFRFVIDGSTNPVFEIDTDHGFVGLGTAGTPGTQLHVHSFTDSVYDGIGATRSTDTAASGGLIGVGRLRGSSFSSPNAVLSGDTLGTFTWSGQLNSTPGQFDAGAGFTGIATENWDITHRGTELNLLTTLTGTDTRVVVFTVEGDGSLTVGDTVDYETLVTDDDDIPNKKYVDDTIALSSTSLQDAYYVDAGSVAVPADQTVLIDRGQLKWQLATASTNRYPYFEVAAPNGINMINASAWADTSGDYKASNITLIGGKYDNTSPAGVPAIRLRGSSWNAGTVGDNIEIDTVSADGNGTPGDILISSGKLLTFEANSTSGITIGNSDGAFNAFGTEVNGLRFKNYATASLPTVPANAFGSMVFDSDTDRLKVWVTDSDGSGTDGWLEVSLAGDASLAAGSGMTISSGDINLGTNVVPTNSSAPGLITRDTYLYDIGGSYRFRINLNNNNDSQNSFIMNSGTSNYVYLGVDDSGAERFSSFRADQDKSILSAGDSDYETRFTVYSDRNASNAYSIKTGSDYSSFKGVEYEDDYSANFVNRSLVDKEYVDNQISGSATKWDQYTTLNIGNQTATLTAAPTTGVTQLRVYLNGNRLVPSSEFTITNTTTGEITLTAAQVLTTGDIVMFDYVDA